MEATNISAWIAGRTNYRIIRRREYNASSTRVTNIKQASVFKVQQVDHSLKSDIQRKIHEMGDQLEDIKRDRDVIENEHRRIKQAYQAAQAERKAIDDEKGKKQAELTRWHKIKASLEPMEEELKQKLVGGDNYRENIKVLNERNSALALKKAKDALEYGVSLVVSVHYTRSIN